MPSLRVYVPNEPTIIAAGSAVVGPPPDRSRLRVDYEGDVYGNGWSFGKKLLHASDRHVTEYPTVARCWVSPEALAPVGWYDRDTDELIIDDRAAAERLAAWIGAEAESCDARLPEGPTLPLTAIAAPRSSKPSATSREEGSTDEDR